MRNRVSKEPVQYIIEYTLDGEKTTFDATKDFSSWDDFETEITRDGLSGAYITIQDTGISFTGESYEIIKSILSNYGVSAKVKLYINLRKDTFPNLWGYENKVILDLNFIKYTEDKSTITLSANENGLKALIKANESQTYDIPISELETSDLLYDGLSLNQSLSWFTGSTISERITLLSITTPPIPTAEGQYYYNSTKKEIFESETDGDGGFLWGTSYMPESDKTYVYNSLFYIWSDVNLTLTQKSIGSGDVYPDIYDKYGDEHEFVPNIVILDQNVNSNYKNFIVQGEHQLIQFTSEYGWAYWDYSARAWRDYTGELKLISLKKRSNFTIKIKAELEIEFYTPSGDFKIYLIGESEEILITHFAVSTTAKKTTQLIDVSIDIPQSNLSLNYYLKVRFKNGSNSPYLMKFDFVTGSYISVEWDSMPKYTISSKVITEQTLAQALVNRLTESWFAISKVHGSKTSNNNEIEINQTSFTGLLSDNIKTGHYLSKINGTDVSIEVISVDDILYLIELSDNIDEYVSGDDVDFVFYDKKPYSAIVEPHEYPVVISSGESIRNFTNAYIHTSMSDFIRYMQSCWGYEYDISDEVITFKHRDSIFDKSISLEISESNNYKKSINETYIYSGVKIGISKIEYDNINGTDEFRFIEEWSTGITQTTSKLELISPYRTDAFGFQLLSEKQYDANSSDNESDNSVFVLHVKQNNTIFVVDRSIKISGIKNELSMFNTIFSPRLCLIRNSSLLGVGSRSLKFTSSEGNSDVEIDGISEKEPIFIDEQVFTESVLDIDIGEIVDMPNNKNGVAKVNCGSDIFYGSIKKLVHNWGKDKKTSATLYIKNNFTYQTEWYEYVVTTKEYNPVTIQVSNNMLTAYCQNKTFSDITVNIDLNGTGILISTYVIIKSGETSSNSIFISSSYTYTVTGITPESDKYRRYTENTSLEYKKLKTLDISIINWGDDIRTDVVSLLDSFEYNDTKYQELTNTDFYNLNVDNYYKRIIDFIKYLKQIYINFSVNDYE